MFRHSGSSCHYDEEGLTGRNPAIVSGEYYIAVLAAFLGCAGIFGFLTGSGIFISAFLVRKAKLPVLKAVIAGAIFCLCLYLIARQLNLEYPGGLFNLVMPFWP